VYADNSLSTLDPGFALTVDAVISLQILWSLCHKFQPCFCHFCHDLLMSLVIMPPFHRVGYKLLMAIVSLSVLCLTPSQEWEGVGNWNMAWRNRVTDDLWPDFKKSKVNVTRPKVSHTGGALNY